MAPTYILEAVSLHGAWGGILETSPSKFLAIHALETMNLRHRKMEMQPERPSLPMQNSRVC